MNSHEDLFNDAPANDDLLYQIFDHYMLQREDGWCDIDVCRVVTGTDTGTIHVIPKLAGSAAFEKYHGHGTTAEDALRDCFRKIKGLPYACLFPSLALNVLQEDDENPDNWPYEGNGHLQCITRFVHGVVGPTLDQHYAHHYPESLRDGVEVLDVRRPISTNLAQPLGQFGVVSLIH